MLSHAECGRQRCGGREGGLLAGVVTIVTGVNPLVLGEVEKAALVAIGTPRRPPVLALLH